MNYIKLINAFWEIKRDREDFTAQIHSLYFTLLFFANKSEWKSFSLYREDLTSLAEISNGSYYSARETLKEAGLITFNEGKNRKTKCLYTVLPVYQNQDTKKTQDGHKEDIPEDTKSTSPDTILDKPLNSETDKHLNNIEPLFKDEDSNSLKTKKGKEKSSAKKEKVTIDFGDFDTPEFRAKWQEFLDHRRKIKKPVSTIASEQRLFTPLTAYDINFAIKLIEETVDSGKWLKMVYDNTPEKYRQYLGKKPPQQPTQYGIKHLDPNAPDYYEQLEKYYAVGKAS